MYLKPNTIYIYWGHIPSYVSNPELASTNRRIEYKPPPEKKPKFRNIDDYHKGSNFIYDLPNYKKKKRQLFLK